VNSTYGLHDDARMIKRLGMSLIWFYAGWYAGAMAAFFGGFSPMIGPVIGVLAAAFYIGDTRGMWGTRRAKAAVTAASTSPVLPEPAD
jgi:hypothetical protein